MEENIKILEESIKEAYRCYDYDLDYNPLSKGIAEMIEHLIKAYKELEYKYNKALSDLVQAEHKKKELEEENQQIETIKDEAIRRYNFESIPVSLVEETIEEYRNKAKEFIKMKEYNQADIKMFYVYALQELLEKRN